jgi:hypothetical protein
MAQGFVYLAAVIDRYSRRGLAWRVSTSMETAFCIDAAEEALQRYGDFQHRSGLLPFTAAGSGRLKPRRKSTYKLRPAVQTSGASSPAWRHTAKFSGYWQRQKQKPPIKVASEQLTRWFQLVGATGFEPATTCPPGKCATRLRYAPKITRIL